MREYFFWIIIVFGRKNICQPEIQIDPLLCNVPKKEPEKTLNGFFGFLSYF